MIYLIIIFIIIFIILLPIKVTVKANLEQYQIEIYKLKVYKKKYLEIKDIKKERNVLKYLKIFRLIDIQKVILDVGGLSNYYTRAINYGIINALFNIIGVLIKDQFIFEYYLSYYSSPKINFKCIIKSNLGKIILGLLKRRK